MPMAVKPCKVSIYNEEPPSINSQGPLITWYLKFTENIRSVISLLPQGLWSPNLAKWELTE